MRDAAIAMPNGIQASLERFTAHERLSELFVIEAVVLCEEDGVDFFPALGGDVTITVSDEDGPVRYFHGLLYESEYMEQVSAGFRHRLLLRPWAYPLTRNLNFKIFQNMTAVDIVKSVVDNNGGKADFSAVAARQSREYCVQFRENDFAFISRLLEEEGIYYFFKHEDGRHTMVFCDGPSSHTDTISLPFKGQRGTGLDSIANLWRWSERIATTAETSAKLRNFDFKRPDQPQEKLYADGEKAGGETAVVYDYPAPAYLEPDDGLARTQRALEAARRERRLYLGEGDAPKLACGSALTLTDHPVDRFNQDYVVVGLIYSIESQVYRSGDDAGGAQGVQVEAVPKMTPWRPPLVTPRPSARGPETATVVGPSGETIYTDEFGRVKVSFPWDTSTPGSDPTCWIRVSHNSAGAGFGNIILPRIGQEVIVDFLDGDPDRPIITGRVYNKSRTSTYALPEHKTRSVWRSQTIGATGQDYDEAETPPSGPGWNEIRMEDKSGAEEIWTHAQRFMRTWVRLDEDHKVGRDQTERVGRSRTTAIKKDDTTTVETGNQSITVSQGDLTLKVAQGKRTTTIQQDDALTVAQGDLSTTVSLGNMSTAVKMGDVTMKVDLGSVSIEAMQKIELKVGQSSVVIDQMGVTIKGMMIQQEATVQWSSKGLMTQLEADAMTTVKGAIVMIN